MWSHVPATVMPNYSKWIADANNAKAPVFSEAYYAQKYHMAKAAVVNKKFQDTYKNAAGHAFNPYGQYSYKFSALTFSNSSGFAGRYMCEIDKNDTSHPLTVTYKFISSWTVLTPYTTNNEFTVTLQPGE